MPGRLSFTHILQIDFVKEPSKTIAIVEIDIISALAIPLSSDFPKMWVRIKPGRQGLLRSPRGGTYPPWLAWGTSCPVRFLVLVAMQDIQSGVVIAIQGRTTVRTRMPTHAEVFLDNIATPGTCLARIMGSDFHHRATSLFRFVARDGDEGSPACIQNTLIQSAFGGGSIRKILALLVFFGSRGRRHVFNLQVLKHQRAILLDQFARGFVQEITASVAHLAKHPRQGFLGSVTATGAFLAPVNRAMSFLDLRFCTTIVARVGNLGAIGKHGKGFDSQVDSHDFLTGVEGHGWIKLVLRDDDGIPLVAFSFDGTRLDLALYLPMHFDLDMTNLGETQAIPDDLIAALGIGEGVIAITSLEAGIARSFTVVYTTEEGRKGFVEPFEHILLHLRVNVLVLFPKLLDIWQLLGLHLIEDRDPRHVIGISPLLQRRIVQLFAATQGPFQGSNLLPGRVEAKLIRLAPCALGVLGLLGHAYRLSFWLFLRWSPTAVRISPLRERLCILAASTKATCISTGSRTVSLISLVVSLFIVALYYQRATISRGSTQPQPQKRNGPSIPMAQVRGFTDRTDNAEEGVWSVPHKRQVKNG